MHELNVANSREPEKRKKFVRYYCDNDLNVPHI